MKFVFVALIAVAFCARSTAKDLFAARCVPALTKGAFTWRIEESRRGVLVRYSDPKKKFSTEVVGADADVLRAKIAALRLSSADIAVLRSREVRSPDGKILLRPFDGVTYHFTMPAGIVIIDNPTFDLEHHPTLEETIRLREFLDFLEHLRRIAKKEKEANKAPEPTRLAGAVIATGHLRSTPRRISKFRLCARQRVAHH